MSLTVKPHENKYTQETDQNGSLLIQNKLKDINTKYERICKMSSRTWCYERITKSEIRNMQN